MNRGQATGNDQGAGINHLNLRFDKSENAGLI